MTMIIEITVPLPTQTPSTEMTGSVVIIPIRSPEDAMIVPEVMTVGKDRFRVCIIACFFGISPFSSAYQVDMTIA